MYESPEQPNLLKVSVEIESPCLFLDMRGELDLCNVKDVPREAYVSRPDLTTVLIDLGELTFCDIAGLRALMRFRRIHEAQGREVVVVRANPFLLRVMRLCGITDRLQFATPAVAPV
jgi:anti-anti-sigma factor